MRFSLVVLVMLLGAKAWSQSSDTLSTSVALKSTGPRIIVQEKKVEKKPGTAALLSAIVPGAGHLYIGKPVKTAIILAGLAGGIYAAQFNIKQYNYFKDNYIARLDDDPNTNSDPALDEISVEGLQQGYEFHRRYRDLSIILTSLGYVLNILWASVDTHLLYFDVSEDISLNIRPSLNYFDKPQPGFTLALTLK